MAFTEIQKARCSLHMGRLAPDKRGDYLSQPSEWSLNIYPVEIELMVVGSQALPVDPGSEENSFLDGSFFYAGQRVAEPQSLLWACEVHYIKMNPINLDASLTVVRAGDLKLRADEREARTQAYQEARYKLCSALGFRFVEYEDIVNPMPNRYRGGGHSTIWPNYPH
jgi:hypothetical protein